MNETKEYILKTSMLLFLQKSYKEVTMKEIVSKTGLSKGAFYHYFSSKEALFKEIVLLFFRMGNMNYETFTHDSLKGFIDEYISRTETSFQQINDMLGGGPEDEVSFNFFYLLFDAMKRFPEMLPLEEEMFKNDLKVWQNVINLAKASGEIKSSSSSKHIASLFLYCTDGVFIRIVNTAEQVKYKDKLEESFYTIYDNLKT